MFKAFVIQQIIISIIGIPGLACGMHTTEGILPPKWAIFWYIIIIPFVTVGIVKIKKREIPGFMSLVGIVGAAVFVFSCLPTSVVALNGMTTAHPAGTGRSATLLGPFVSVVIPGKQRCLNT